MKALEKAYDKLQLKYGDKSLDSIYYGGCIENPEVCFVFMNPTGKNIVSSKNWKGIKSPWLGTKNIWDLFYEVGLFDEKIYLEIKSKTPKDWTEEFASLVYKEVEDKNYFITNLAKCTQVDARPLKDEVYKEYLPFFLREIELLNPKKIILFGNQVSSIVLNQKITVSTVRKKEFSLKIKDKIIPCYAVFYPIGNGRFNIDKSIEDIKYILSLKD